MTEKPSHREYFFEIDERGNVLHNGNEIDDKPFIHVFFTRLKKNDSGKYSEYPYYSPCGYEINYVKVTDTPIVFQRWEDNKLWYHDTLSMPFEPETLRFSDEGILYHKARVGNYGRIAMPALMHLSEYLQPFGDFFLFHNPSDSIAYVVEPLEMPENIKVLRPKIGNLCFGCGMENTSGLHLSFIYNKVIKRTESWFVAPDKMTGSLNIMHGGFVALLLDETMGKVLSGQGIKAPTGTLSVRYHKPTPIGKTLHLIGEQISENGRKYVIKGEIRDEHKTLLAEAEGLFIRVNAP